MAITINWSTKVITIPKADTTLVDIGPPELRSLNVNTFRLALKALEDDEEGIPFDNTHIHNTEVTVGGITYARFIEIINGYTITFEAGAYAVDLSDANNNIIDVLNLNSTQVRSNNSAGLQTVISGSGVTEQDKLDISDRVWDEAKSEHIDADSFGEEVQSHATSTEILNLLGVTGENVIWTGLNHDSNNNLIAATITQFTDNTLTVTRKAWILAATYNTNSELTSYQLKEI